MCTLLFFEKKKIMINYILYLLWLILFITLSRKLYWHTITRILSSNLIVTTWHYINKIGSAQVKAQTGAQYILFYISFVIWTITYSILHQNTHTKSMSRQNHRLTHSHLLLSHSSPSLLSPSPTLLCQSPPLLLSHPFID